MPRHRACLASLLLLPFAPACGAGSRRPAAPARAAVTWHAPGATAATDAPIWSPAPAAPQVAAPAPATPPPPVRLDQCRILAELLCATPPTEPDHTPLRDRFVTSCATPSGDVTTDLELDNLHARVTGC